MDQTWHIHRNDAHFRGIFMDRSYSYCEELCIFFGTFEVTALCEKKPRNNSNIPFIVRNHLVPTGSAFSINAFTDKIIMQVSHKSPSKYGVLLFLGLVRPLAKLLQISPTNDRCSLSHQVIAPGTLSFRPSPSTRPCPCWQWARLRGRNPGVSSSSSWGTTVRCLTTFLPWKMPTTNFALLTGFEFAG